MKNKWKVIVASVLVGATLVGAPLKAVAQADPRDKIIPSLELNEADVRDALRIIFKTVGVSYSISADVIGTITVNLKDVPFETALRNVLGQVNATYRVEGGIYTIILKPTEVAPGTTETDTGPAVKADNPPRRIKIRSADPQLIILLLQGSFNVQMAPEMSTNIGGGGYGGGFGGGGYGGGFGGGGLGGGGFGGGGYGGFGGGGFGGGGLGGGGFGGFGGGGYGGFGGGGYGGGGFGGGGRGGF